LGRGGRERRWASSVWAGLGHMGVKLAHAMGAKVVLFTTSPGKIADGKKLGADDVVISKDEKDMARYNRKFDFIVNTVAGTA